MEIVLKLARLLEAASSIELLPGDATAWSGFVEGKNEHAPFIFIEGNLGVPEKDLYKVYFAASKAFSELHPSSLLRTGRLRDLSDAVPLTLTSVILLANSAHQTALNLRKTMVRYGHRSHQDELQFVKTLLTVKQSSKVSMLWHHRRWLLQFGQSPAESSISATDVGFVDLKLSPEILIEELKICSSACEVYPRNYYAWFHRSLCMQCCATQAAAGSVQHAGMLKQEKTELKHWINVHVSDHSAMHYLCNVIEALLESLSAFSDAQTLVSEIRDHALQLLQSYPTHESLWMYFRRAFEPWETQSAAGRCSVPSAKTAEDEAKILMNTHKRISVGRRSEDDKLVVDHARCYLAWKGGKWKSGGSDTPRSLTAGDRI